MTGEEHLKFLEDRLSSESKAKEEEQERNRLIEEAVAHTAGSKTPKKASIKRGSAHLADIEAEMERQSKLPEAGEDEDDEDDEVDRGEEDAVDRGQDENDEVERDEVDRGDL